MQFNGESNHQDIVTLSNKKIKQNDRTFPLVEKALYANEAGRIILSWMVSVYAGWQVDDSNYPNLPEPTTTLTANQRQYSLPTESSDLFGVAVLDESADGGWRQLTAVTLEQIQQYGAESEYRNIAGNPQEYRPTSNGFILYPASNYTRAAALKIYIGRDSVSFTPASTSQAPGFDSKFHEAVPTYMALQFASINGLKNELKLQKEWDGNELVTGKEGGWKRAIKKHYAARFRQMFPPRLRTTNAVEEYI